VSDSVHITFGMIVMNGEPFTRYNLRSLYPYAHQIIVVEGACPGARNIATPDGHSRDGTLEVLHRFQAEEDPEHKLVIVTGEDEGRPDGFWTEKDEMSQAYAKRATGNYLWQVDSDEFYREEDMASVISMLNDDHGITAASFRTLTFWGSTRYIVDGYHFRAGARDFHRLFAWGDGYNYTAHRPPTVCDDSGRDTRDVQHVTAREMAKRGVYMYHYSLLLPKQVTEKCDYYSRAKWNSQGEAAVKWAKECYDDLRRPFRVHGVYSHVSWLERFAGTHPTQIESMMANIVSGSHEGIALRDNSDVEALLSGMPYRLARAGAKLMSTPVIAVGAADPMLRCRLSQTPIWPLLKFIKRILGGRPNAR